MLLVPAALIGYGVYKAATTYDQANKKLHSKVAEYNKRTPVSNRYSPGSSAAFIEGRQPVRVIPDIDLRGAPVYFNDYGSGGLVREYTQPAYLANHGRFSLPE